MQEQAGYNYHNEVPEEEDAYYNNQGDGHIGN